ALPILFNATFAHGAGGRARTLEDWRWAYARNPAGMRVWVALQGDELVAHYASQPHVVRVDGAPQRFAHIVDSMAHPGHRRTLHKNGPFAAAGEQLLSATVGAGKDWVAYGWPTPDAWRIGRLLLAYELVRRQTTLVQALGDGPRELPSGVERVQRFDERVGALYERCAPEWRASGVRDAQFLNWRVCDAPAREYRALAAVDAAGAWSGCAIARELDVDGARHTVLCDWLVPRDDEASADRLLAALSADARAHGSQQLVAMMPSWSPWFARFQRRGFLVCASPYMMVSGGFNHPHYDVYWLRDHWWYQPLDTDSV
ncbi:MAG: GNAT family N-acetyltransferase, partial [Planctomycetota bacterium]